LNRGADVNVKSAEGWAPLHLAAEEGHKDLGELLIDKGADVNVKSAEGWAPLHVAAVYGQKDVAELLISKGADVATPRPPRASRRSTMPN